MNGGFKSIDQLIRPSIVLIQASPNAKSLRNRSFPKNEKVISKKEMVYCKNIPSNLEVFDKAISFFFEQQSWEDFSTQNEEERGKRITLSQPSLRGEKSKGASI